MWKRIKDFDDYEVSEDGEVRSLKYGKETILKGIGIKWKQSKKNGKKSCSH